MTADPKAIPPGWCIAALGSLGRYLNGRGFKKSEWSDRGRPIIRIQNLTGSSDGFNYFEGYARPDHEVEPGDLLVSWAATLGAYRWRGPRAVLNQHIFKVESFIDGEFHLYILQWALGALYRSAHGSGMVHVTKSKFDRTPIPLPPRKEQHRIVSAIESYFTRLDDAVATLERVQRSLKRYRASVLKAAVEGRLVPTEAELARAEGRSFEPASVLLVRVLAERRRRWEEAELAKMTAKGKAPKDDKWKAKYVAPVAPDTTELPELPEGWCWASLDSLLREPLRNGHSARRAEDGDVRTLTLSAVTEREFSVRNTKVTAAERETVQDLWLEAGDIFVERSNTPELVGTTALYSGPSEFAIFPDLLIRVRLVGELLPAYVEAVLRSDRVRRFFQQSAQGIAGSMPKISQDTVGRVAVPMPTQAEQARIVAEVDRLLSIAERAETVAAASQHRNQRLRQSVLKWAFEGRIVDQDPTDEPASVLLERIRAERASATAAPPRRACRSNTRAAKS